jgi:hypothetical protein
VNCTAFVDRMYDDDVRSAQRRAGETPPDIAAHMLTCDNCRAAYHAARADDLLLTTGLLEVPSPAWRAEVLRQMSRSPRAFWSLRIAAMNEMVIGGILAVASSQIVLGDSSTAAYVAAFCAGGTAALLRASLTKHWQMLRRPPRWV